MGQEVPGRPVVGGAPTLAPAEQALRYAAAALALISVGFAGSYLARGVWGDAEYPFVVNSIAKDALLAGVSLLVFWDVRRWSPIAVPLIVAAHLLMPTLLGLTALTGTDDVSHTVGDGGTLIRWLWLGADVGIVVLLLTLHTLAARSRYDLRYLPPSAFRSLMALAEILVVKHDRDVAPAEVAGRVDHYLASFRAREKWKIRLALVALAYWPLLTLRPPLHIMSPELREPWVRRRLPASPPRTKSAPRPSRASRSAAARSSRSSWRPTSGPRARAVNPEPSRCAAGAFILDGL